MKKKDFLLVSLIGVLFGLLLLPVIKNLHARIFSLTFINVILMVFGFAVFAVIALWIASLVAKRVPVVLQFVKFAAVGALNTLIDLGILNLMIYIFNHASGIWFSIFKGTSFIIANINAYFWNKYWTFGNDKEASIKEFSQFLTVSVIGFVLNIGTAALIVSKARFTGVSAGQLANIGALAAVAVSLVWNFIGYKFIVFKKSNEIKTK
ncbi:MAG: GtrA family protein [Patescibacteria group bacterium]|nr:GtrA family protein [Patescibacteria group bacterium]